MDDVNKLYPAFVLAFCIFSKKAYLEEIIRLVKSFKFTFWGHDLTVLHSAKLRKRLDDFQFLHDQVIEIYQFLRDSGQENKLTHIIIESRGKKEDDELQDTFQEIIETHDNLQNMYPLDLCFADKKTNSIGLQIADLVAYPIGRFLIDPGQKNPAFKIIEKKFRKYPEYYGIGYKIFTHATAAEKRKTPEFSEV